LGFEPDDPELFDELPVLLDVVDEPFGSLLESVDFDAVDVFFLVSVE
jgi:hypothetical protein